MTQSFSWLKDQSRHSEVLEWLGEHWNIDQLEAWSRGRFGLDELKTWTDGKYPLGEVVRWVYHESDESADLAATVIGMYRPGVEEHKGTIAFLGIDADFNVHIAFDGACGSCTLRETATMDNLKEDLDKYIPGIKSLTNDGPVRAATGNYAEQDFSLTGEATVQIRSLGIDPISRSTPN